jgi:hypothetical protein
MSTARITVTLERPERAALMQFARQERRDPRQQAAIILRRELERQGYLKTEHGAQHATPVQVGDDAAESTQGAESAGTTTGRGGTASRAA